MSPAEKNSTTAVTPSKVVCIGRNYVDHIKELGNEVPSDMVVFLKPNSAIAEELIAFHQEPIHYETELCFLIKDGEYSAVGIGLDLTKRAMQSLLKQQQLPWERAKAFNGSAVFSDFIPLNLLDKKASSHWCFELSINGKVIQVGHSDLMMYSAETIKKSVAEFISLEDGDIIMTGTPKGVGVVNEGDVFKVRLWTGIEYINSDLLLHNMLSNQPNLTHQWIAK
ncbi:fumarylacetoacetate hydrolase family protein [Shewanella donghaensis]|uniref:fumarylacetoacetate hydrolase family protein n=1 Tax=Shewanella donghaensis TaxID=238836 RepID=UPI00118465F7|nr:fumarylacetoacetate hydrolase family protein [Shewanella donghaensis]